MRDRVSGYCPMCMKGYNSNSEIQDCLKRHKSKTEDITGEVLETVKQVNALRVSLGMQPVGLESLLPYSGLLTEVIRVTKIIDDFFSGKIGADEFRARLDSHSSL